MKIKHTVEYDCADYLEVEFEGFPRWENDSFDYAGTHCTGGRSGTCRLPSYVSMEYYGDATWNKTLYTPEQNLIIEEYLASDKNREKLDNDLCNAFIKSCEP